MITPLHPVPFIGLVDDDHHSAYLFARTIAAFGVGDTRHLGGEIEACGELARVLNDPRANWPDLLVVDLRAHSGATLDFLRRHAATLYDKGVTPVVMVPPTDRAERTRYLEDGAAAVFFRQPERDAYRRELAGILDFRARNARLDAVGM
ncbi:hypothetical protein VW35_07160 [Devosia soli]|uniref:Response regulatory domain-containing protein n=1 Tax=Devosia soli TaxID=361041 RepID=A0A0F5LDD1_9HYPH|nr:hypothetical protein [Devosia soli]KKB80194.1 hypothetical protein VW35_07160 [Devosia soli]